MAGKENGHYCKICGERKSNESFSGKGHANHICKSCSKLSAADKAEVMALTRLANLPVRRLTDAEKKWLENRTKDKRPAVRELAAAVYSERFPHADTNRKKQTLKIQELTFSVNSPIIDEYSEDTDIKTSFLVQRSDGSIRMTDFTNGTERRIVHPSKVSSVLKQAVHSLEIFTWEERFCGENAETDSEDCGSDLEDILENLFGDSDTISNDNTQNAWDVTVKYTDGSVQEYGHDNAFLPEPVCKLYSMLSELFAFRSCSDYVKAILSCSDLISLNTILLSLSQESDETLAVTWMELLEWYSGQKDECALSEKPYKVYSAADAVAGYLLTVTTTASSKSDADHATVKEQLAKFRETIASNITPSVGGIVSKKDIEMILSAIDEKYRVISKLFADRRLSILLLDNSHRVYNTLCCTKQVRSGEGKNEYELFLFHKKDESDSHSAYIFLHEIGHILQMELTNDTAVIPESFIKMSNGYLGTELKQDDISPEIFADAFAIAMITIFGWSEFDSFPIISQKVKNSFAVYMDWLLPQI